MQRTLIALACTLAFAGGSALAQQGSGTSSSPSQSSSGGSFTEKAKDTMHRIGEKTKSLFRKGEDKASTAKADHDSKTAKDADEDTKAMGASRGDKATAGADTDRQKRMDQAYGDYQSKSGQSSSTSKSPNR